MGVALVALVLGYLAGRALADTHDTASGAMVEAMVRVAQRVDLCEVALEWSEADRLDAQTALGEILQVRRAAMMRTTDVIRENPWLCTSARRLPPGGAPPLPVDAPLPAEVLPLADTPELASTAL